MKSYKISQTIEKNLYPIEAALTEIIENDRKRFRHFWDIIAPVILSSILTVAFGGSIIPNRVESSEGGSPAFWERVFFTWWGKVICIIAIFAVLSFIIFLICRILHRIANKKDIKRNAAMRERIAKDFYKIIIPEIITGVSLFERAYEIETATNQKGTKAAEIDAEDIVLCEMDESQTISNKAVLYYYEAFYHFKLVAAGIEKDQLVECKNADRENLWQLYQIIGVDALRKAIRISRHCVKEICKRIEDAEEEQLLRIFDNYNRNLLN